MTIYDKKRVVAGIMVVLLVAAAANWHFEFVFPRFAQLIMALIVLIGVLLFPFRPTGKDFEEHSERKLIDAQRTHKADELKDICVFVVQHAHQIANGREGVKLIGVYASQAKAQEAVDRLRPVEGFRDHPDGFSIDRYIVGRDHWSNGFISV